MPAIKQVPTPRLHDFIIWAKRQLQRPSVRARVVAGGGMLPPSLDKLL